MLKTAPNKMVALSVFASLTVFLVTVCMMLPNLAVAQDQPATLSPVKMRILNNKVVPSIAAANQQQTFLLVSSLFNSATAAEVKLIDQFFVEKGFSPATEFYAETSVSQMVNGSFQGQPTENQARIIDEHLQGQLATRLAAVKQRQSDLRNRPFPTELAKADQLFWQLYIQHNKIDTTIRLAQFASRLLGTAQNTAADQLLELKSAKVNLLKTEAKFRLKQLESGVAKLEAANDFRGKFKSLIQIGAAKSFFDSFFDNYFDSFADKDLAATFRDNVNAKIVAAKTGNEAIVEKVVLLQTGLEWWFRGRYGVAEQAGGLLKPLRAMQDSQVMLSLDLPSNRPTPSTKIVFTSLTDPQRPEYFERRHHYNWKIGHRERLAEGSGDAKIRVKYDVPRTNCHGTAIGRRTKILWADTSYDFEKVFDDSNIVPRLVGSYEYWNSLRSLDELVRKSTPEQLAVYDELVSERPDLSINVGLAKAFGGEKVSFDATTIDFNQLQKANGTGAAKRTGLAWLTALARIELGTSLSAYTDAKAPFEKIAPTDFDRRQYEVIFYDDAMMHVLALNDDQDFQSVTKKTSKANLLSLDYWRRLKLVRDMVDLAMQSQLNNGNRKEVFEVARRKLKRKAQQLFSSIQFRIAQIEQREIRQALGDADIDLDTANVAAGFLKADGTR